MHPGGARDGERGASLVEFALLAPVFFMLIFGMFTGGLALNDKQQMTHAVREGARYGSTIPASELPGDSFASTVRDQTVFRSNGLLDAADICVSLVRGTPDATAQDTAQSVPAGTVKASEVVSTTKPDGTACEPDETYPNPREGGDTGQRVQVSASRVTEIELLVFGRYGVNLDVSSTAKSEFDS